jgi:lactoylglutathione lyase
MASTYIGAMGVGVSNLELSTDFYCRVMGMKKLQTMHLEHMNEEVLGFDGRGASLVLMHWIDGSERQYLNNPIKIVIYVPDAAAIIEAVRAEGLEIVKEPTTYPSMNNAIIAFAKDPDGYLVELIQKPPK